MRLRVTPVLLLATGIALGLSYQSHQGGWPVTGEPTVFAGERTATWRGEIAPIVFQNCASCHHTGGSAPFALTTYADARRWGPQMVQAVESGYMPPWLPEPTGGPHPVHFVGERRLSHPDVETLAAWVKAGSPEGQGPKPHAPVFAQGWQMGTPDLVVEMPEAVTVPASGSDIFMNFILPVPSQSTRWVRAMEIQPGSSGAVHHANVLIDRKASLRGDHLADWKAGIPGMDLRIDSGDAFDPDSHFLFWKPDSTALVEPDGMPWRLDPGNDLVLNMHLKPTGKPETIRARIGLYFTPQPARKRPILVELEDDADLKIPAGDPHFEVTDQLTLPVAADLLGVYPHAHYLGHTMEAWAVLPDGVRQPILLIRNWDIDRQAVYQLKEPLALPAGTVLHMRYAYDNSAANVHNPHTPPVPVSAGNRATDEMGHLWLQLLPKTTPGDAEPTALAANDGNPDPRMAIEAAWMEDILRKSPDDALALYNRGALYAMEGKPKEAEAAYRRLLAHNPSDARTLTALGGALEAQGENSAAAQAFQAALAAKADDPDATFDLATLELRSGQSAAAEAAFRELLRLHPEDAPSVEGLSAALLAQGRATEAEPMLLRVVADRPSDPEARRLLAEAYAGEGRLADTVEALKAWAKLTPGQPDAHRALAQVLSGAGQADAAVEEQKEAVRTNPASAGDWSDLGVLEARAGQKASARAAFEKALALDPGSAAARANLARLSGPDH